MRSVQQIQHLQSFRVKVVAVDKTVCVLFAGPLTSHFIDAGTVEAHAIVVVRITNMNVRNLDDMVGSMKQLNAAHNMKPPLSL